METSTLHQLFLTANGVTTDSRNCPQDSMFFALRGDSFNGNMYAAQALEKGCSYAVVDDEAYYVENDKRYILVDDALKALQQLAHFHRQQFDVKVIGITGTNGKTTTKELIAAVLSMSYNVLYTQGNLNNHIGVPLTLLNLKPEHDFAVVEMGANHPGEIRELATITDPDYGIITNVGKAHLEGFGSFENVIATKAELYDYLRTKSDSVVFLDGDNEHLIHAAWGIDKIIYAEHPLSYVNGSVTGNSPYLEFEWNQKENVKIYHVKTHLIGDYNFKNALAAATIGYYFGVKPTLICKAIHKYLPQNNRSQLTKTSDNTLIIDAYNANPTSMEAAIANFKKMDAPHKMLILGDMRELGDSSMEEHQRVISLLEDAGFEEVILVGDMFAVTNHPYKSYANVTLLIEELKKHKPTRKTILIKGSNGTKLIQVVDYL